MNNRQPAAGPARSSAVPARGRGPLRLVVVAVLACLLAAGCSSFGSSDRGTASRGGASRKAKQTEESSWFGSLFQEEPNKPKTVNEFLKRPRPE
jgi:hypothetical protein